MDEIMTLEEVASYLRVSERTVYDWVSRGELPGGKLGTSWRFKRADIENWVSKKISPRLPLEDPGSPSLASLLTPECVDILHQNSKDGALNRMIDLCVNIPGLSSRAELAEAVFKREQLMSTGIGLSISVPHVRLASVKEIHMAFGVSDIDISDYESLDGKPVRIIVLIVAGRDQHAQYIKTLARVSRLLKDESVRNELLQIRDKDQLYKTIIERDRQS